MSLFQFLRMDHQILFHVEGIFVLDLLDLLCFISAKYGNWWKCEIGRRVLSKFVTKYPFPNVYRYVNMCFISAKYGNWWKCEIGRRVLSKFVTKYTCSVIHIVGCKIDSIISLSSANVTSQNKTNTLSEPQNNTLDQKPSCITRLQWQGISENERYAILNNHTTCQLLSGEYITNLPLIGYQLFPREIFDSFSEFVYYRV